MEIVIVWIIFSGIAALIAGNKGRSAVGFFFLSMLLSPLIGIIIAAVIVFSLVGFYREKNVAEEAIQEEKKKLEEEKAGANPDAEEIQPEPAPAVLPADEVKPTDKK